MGEHDKVNILLVDDQLGKLLSYEVILSELGENLIKASSARKAFAHLLKTDIAILLVDVCMPELDGFELAAMIRDTPLPADGDHLHLRRPPDRPRPSARLRVRRGGLSRSLSSRRSCGPRSGHSPNYTARHDGWSSLIASWSSVLRRGPRHWKPRPHMRESEQRQSLALAAGGMGSWDHDLLTDHLLWDEGQRVHLRRRPGEAPRRRPSWPSGTGGSRTAAARGSTGCGNRASLRPNSVSSGRMAKCAGAPVGAPRPLMRPAVSFA